MKTEIKDGHRLGVLGSVTDLNDEFCFGNGTMHELAVIDAKAKTGTILRAEGTV
jgi:hypothetical protein